MVPGEPNALRVSRLESIADIVELSLKLIRREAGMER